ncbi:MAG: septal ring lytic transglycosylase RlpA family protein [bacterium]
MSKFVKFFIIIFICLGLLGCSLLKSSPSSSKGVKTSPSSSNKSRTYFSPAQGFLQTGIASWYGKYFHGRTTASGEVYNMNAMTAAHKTLPMDVYVRVTNLNNGRSDIVKINDRGPFVKDRIIDLSYLAAQKLGMVESGTALVRIEALGYVRKNEYGQNIFITPNSYYYGRFSIQVGAFSDMNNAINLKSKLASRFDRVYLSPYNNGKAVFYRVRVGSYLDLNQAKKEVSKFEVNGCNNCFVVAE